MKSHFSIARSFKIAFFFCVFSAVTFIGIFPKLVYATSRIAVSPTTISLSENGGSQIFSVALSEPIIAGLGSPALTITLTSSDPRVLVSPGTLTYSNDWFAIKQFTVTTVGSYIANPNNTVTIGLTASSNSEYYNGFTNSASVTLVPYIATYTADTNGTLVGVASQAVDYDGNSTAVTAVPNSGYHFVNWTGAVTSTNNPLVNTHVTEDITETANFAINTSHGGHIIPLVSASALTPGQSLDFSIVGQQGKTVSLSLNANPNTVQGYVVGLTQDLSDNIGIMPFTQNVTYELPDTNSHTIYLKYYSTTGNPSTIISHNTNTISDQTVPIKTTPAESSAFVFTHTIKKYSVDKDIAELQKFLNSNGFTVATTGPGSPGHESTRFGTHTIAALKLFQEAHADEILAPSGSSKSNGQFGPNTIKLINKMLAEKK